VSACMDIGINEREHNRTGQLRRGTAKSSNLRRINLALQGGGSHGAFAWGVLDRLLEDDCIDFDGISATSVGAVNATVLAYGLAVGGRAGARHALADFWRRVANLASLSPLQPTPFDRLTGNQWLETSPVFVQFDLMTRLFSPYQLNPFNINPLRSILCDTVDFDAIRNAYCPIKLFLSATNVRTGKIRIFENDEIGPDAVLASACLPFLFQAIEIDGEHYWDGGYMGNPAIFPLVYNCDSRDVVIVHINPIERPNVPKTAGEILNRINEISFNSSLMREMRSVCFVTNLIEEEKILDKTIKRMLIHSIEADDVMQALSVGSKLNADRYLVNKLMKVGRERADVWIAANFDRLGKQSTIDIHEKYL
jgi:NTE family protein